MLAYLPLLVTSANVRLVFDNPTEAAAFNLDAVSPATLTTDAAFLCEHTGGSRETITCEWQDIVQLTWRPAPTPAPVPIRIS